jgi:tetratricopeptide (TPR) repeat protein
VESLLPQAYLIGLVVLLAIAAVAVARQIWRVRGDEATLARLEGNQAEQAQDAGNLYELASVQLRKRLYGQAADTLKQALKRAQAEQAPAEAVALIQNALGFAMAAQGQFKTAVKHYRQALQSKADYPVALNNLAFALEKQLKPEEAAATYRQALALEPTNKTASKRLARLERSLAA